MGDLDIFNDPDPLAELEGADGHVRVGGVESGSSEVAVDGGVESAIASTPEEDPMAKPGISRATKAVPQKEGRQIMAKDKAEKVKKTPVGLTEDVAKQVRQYQAKLMLATGDKISASDAIGAALKIALK